MRLQKSYKGNLIRMSVKPVRDRQLIVGTAARLEHCTATLPAWQRQTSSACSGWLLGPLITTWNPGSWSQLSALRMAQSWLESGCLSAATHGVSTQGLIWAGDLWLQVYHCIGSSYWLSDNVLSQWGKKEKVPLGTNCGINSLPDWSIEFIYYLQLRTSNL